jgi:hypothetical protein
MSFNTETIYMLWDSDHNGETINFVKEDADSYFFDEDGSELILSKANVVDLGDDHPPADKEEGKHYISTYDGSVSYGFSLPSSQEHSPVSSELSQNSNQSGGRRRSRKSRKSRKSKSRKSKSRKSKGRK